MYCFRASFVVSECDILTISWVLSSGSISFHLIGVSLYRWGKPWEILLRLALILFFFKYFSTTRFSFHLREKTTFIVSLFLFLWRMWMNIYIQDYKNSFHLAGSQQWPVVPLLTAGSGPLTWLGRGGSGGTRTCQHLLATAALWVKSMPRPTDRATPT